MVRLVSLLIVASVLYYIYVVTQIKEHTPLTMPPASVITVEELPPIRAENE